MSSNIINSLPEMLSGNELTKALEVFPPYDRSICEKDQSARLMALSDIYKIFVPSQMAVEIYSKLYLSLLRSLQKKDTKFAIQQKYQNRKAVKGQNFSGIIGGSDSFTIIGTSGIGKSSAISRAVTLITDNRIIENQFSKVIPCITVQCPFDASVKGLLLEILRKVDEEISTKYYEGAIRARATTDMLIGSVSQVALNHIGILIVDEIQHIATANNGKSLVRALTQLINNSGISIAMIGTPECTTFFESVMQLARRSLGLSYTAVEYDIYFENFCKVVFRYQYVKHPVEISPSIIQWLYEHSGGVISIVIYLIETAQEIAILNGVETLNTSMFNAAYEQRMELLHSYIKPQRKNEKAISNVRYKNHLVQNIETQLEADNISISELATKAKDNGENIVALLKTYFPVAEVDI